MNLRPTQFLLRSAFAVTAWTSVFGFNQEKAKSNSLLERVSLLEKQAELVKSN